MHSPRLSSSSAITRERDVQVIADFDWAHQVTDILSRLHGILSDTIVSWKSFSSPGEDVNHFGGTSANAQLSLRAIKSIFRDLKGDEKRLDVLKSRCTEFSRAVSRMLLPSATYSSAFNKITVALTAMI
jgi:hypothetical protein